MTAKEYCTSHDAIAYYSGLSGLEIHGIEYGVDDYVYCASGAWVGKYCSERDASEHSERRETAKAESKRQRQECKSTKPPPSVNTFRDKTKTGKNDAQSNQHTEHPRDKFSEGLRSAGNAKERQQISKICLHG